ncbi:MAG: SHOCT domain-containing protein [Bacteroidales bacterium]
MRNSILLITILFAAMQVYAQKKTKVDPKDAQIDSLTRINAKLTSKADSLTFELVKYTGLYNTIKEKILHYDFDPTRAAFLIDSLQATRDSAALLITNAPVKELPTQDSGLLINQNSQLKAQLDSMNNYLQRILSTTSYEEIEKSKALNDLKKIKDLLDQNIITEEEFNSLKKKYLIKL